MIVMTVTTCVVQASDVMSDIALKNWNMRMNAVDYLSISDEVSVHITPADEGDFACGKWRGRKKDSGLLSGLAFADVEIENEFAGGKEAIERLWNIAGRK
jgi:hypothetical protein